MTYRHHIEAFVKSIDHKGKQAAYEAARRRWRSDHPIVHVATQKTFLSPEDMLRAGPQLIIEALPSE